MKLGQNLQKKDGFCLLQPVCKWWFIVLVPSERGRRCERRETWTVMKICALLSVERNPTLQATETNLENAKQSAIRRLTDSYSPRIAALIQKKNLQVST